MPDTFVVLLGQVLWVLALSLLGYCVILWYDEYLREKRRRKAAAALEELLPDYALPAPPPGWTSWRPVPSGYFSSGGKIGASIYCNEDGTLSVVVSAGALTTISRTTSNDLRADFVLTYERAIRDAPLNPAALAPA